MRKGVLHGAGKVAVTPYKAKNEEPSGSTVTLTESTELKVKVGSGGYVVNKTGVLPELSMPIFRNDPVRSVLTGGAMVPLCDGSPFRQSKKSGYTDSAQAWRKINLFPLLFSMVKLRSNVAVQESADACVAAGTMF
jgi:hypothetical protein